MFGYVSMFLILLIGEQKQNVFQDWQWLRLRLHVYFKIVMAHEWMNETLCWIYHFECVSWTALRESMCLWKETRSRTRYAPSRPRTRRSRLSTWWSPTWIQAPSTRLGQVRSSAPRPELQAARWKKKAKGDLNLILGFMFLRYEV